MNQQHHKTTARRACLPRLRRALLVGFVLTSLPATAQVLEHVTVKARTLRTQAIGDGPLDQPLLPADAPGSMSIADFARQQPSIAFAGQGGLLQTLSIRGLSGQQVANYWGDVPILSERRAGTASSFIDPVMLDSLEIRRGPSSVYYGNGGGAGVLQMTPARPQGLEWQLQLGSEGDENLQYLGAARDDWSLAVSRRSAEDVSTASGESLHTEFEQYNLQVLGGFQLAGRQVDLQQLVAEGRDIGKSNNRYPTRITDYPHERHWLGQVSSSLTEQFDASLYYHYQELDTRVERPAERIDEVSSESLDWGLRLVRHPEQAHRGLRLGMEYLGRRGVDSDEQRRFISDGTRSSTQILNAEQDGMDLFADSSRALGRLVLGAGARWAWQDQAANGQNSVDDSALSAFLRAAWAASDALEFSAELASGSRFPTLSERFFSGTTGRGQVVGNPDLDPEETLGLDLGFTWQLAPVALELRAYGMQIDDYIARVDIAEDVRSFENVTEGEILGLEFAGSIEWAPSAFLDLGGHYIDAQDNDGDPLADAAPSTAYATLRMASGPWQSRLRFEYRFSENDVAAGEAPLDNASMLDASLSRRWGSGLEMQIWGRNLLDESWRLSSDNLATDSPGRSLGITLSWRGG